jgi:hypothetical protein
VHNVGQSLSPVTFLLDTNRNKEVAAKQVERQLFKAAALAKKSLFFFLLGKKRLNCVFPEFQVAGYQVTEIHVSEFNGIDIFPKDISPKRQTVKFIYV